MPTEQPVLIPNQDGSYTLHDQWAVRVNGCVLTIPRGFRTDLASVPRLGWLFIAPNELGGAAPAVAHDYLYRTRGNVEPQTIPPTRFTRRASDRVFRDLMRECGVRGWKGWKRWVAWVGVRLGGGLIWKPDKSQLRNMTWRLLHTLWQSAAAVLLVDWVWSLPPVAWWIPPVAAVLSGVKTLFVAPTIERAVGVLYE